MIELVFAAGILGVGLAGLVHLHRNAVTGVARSDTIALATEIAHQRSEFLATMHSDDVPGCSGPVRCRTPGGQAFEAPLSAVGGFECTRWVDGADVPEANGVTSAQGVRFRVDTVVGSHPDPLRQSSARFVTVSVCWVDRIAQVHQIQTRKLVIPGV